MEGIYVRLAIDSFLSGFIIPLKTELILPVMLAFPEYDHITATLIAYVSSSLGLILNWFVGAFVIKSSITNSSISKNQKTVFDKISGFFNKYLFWVILFSGVPLAGSVITVFSGFFGAKLKRFIALCLIGNAAAYYLIYFS